MDSSKWKPQQKATLLVSTPRHVLHNHAWKAEWKCFCFFSRTETVLAAFFPYGHFVLAGGRIWPYASRKMTVWPLFCGSSRMDRRKKGVTYEFQVLREPPASGLVDLGPRSRLRSLAPGDCRVMSGKTSLVQGALPRAGGGDGVGGSSVLYAWTRQNLGSGLFLFVL